jgi:rubrerythrin
VAELWQKTGDEELNHAAQFTLAMETLSDEITAVSVKASTLDRVRVAVEERIEAYRRRRPSVREALLAAINLEEASQAFHADQILTFRGTKTKRLFRAMMAADHGHLESLRAALATLSPPKS